MPKDVFEIHFVNGNKVRMAGNNIMDAYSQTGNRFESGNINFSMLEFYFRVPVPVQLETEKYQMFLMKDKNSNWEPAGKSTENFEALESLMKWVKVGKEGFLSGLIVRMSDEKIMSWVWA